jgi:rare lipoprotein A (peptidoglycan hydrolase)
MGCALSIPRVSLVLAASLVLVRFGMAASPAVAEHEVTVTDGDSLTAIALQYYGDAGYAQQLAAYNHLQDPDHLVLGQVLKLPDSFPQNASNDGSAVGGATSRGAVELPKTVATTAGTPRAGPVIQMGFATWYGPGFEGRVTKCGQVFHSSDLTASSNDLPCGTVIQVTDIDDGRSVVVTVDDTGDFQHPTILDLSEAAFSALASPDTGVVNISVARMLSVAAPSWKSLLPAP